MSFYNHNHTGNAAAMQPIHYSLILNLVALIAAGLLSWQFSQPLLFVIVIILQTHALERFREGQQQEFPEEDEEQPMGFTANIK